LKEFAGVYAANGQYTFVGEWAEKS
jgi:hypothetical protein